MWRPELGGGGAPEGAAPRDPGSPPRSLQPPATISSPPFPVPVYAQQAPAQVSSGAACSQAL